MSEFCFSLFLIPNDFCYDFDGLEFLVLHKEMVKFKNY